MARKRHTLEQIIGKLGEAEVGLDQASGGRSLPRLGWILVEDVRYSDVDTLHRTHAVGGIVLSAGQ